MSIRVLHLPDKAGAARKIYLICALLARLLYCLFLRLFLYSALSKRPNPTLLWIYFKIAFAFVENLPYFSDIFAIISLDSFKKLE